MKKATKWILGIVALLLAAATYMIGPEAIAAARNGFFEKEVKKEYQGDTIDNLRRLHTALMLYHESEGQFPLASGWMDAIENRLQTNDLKKGEGEKKLHQPAYANSASQYGYAMNDKAQAKYKDDLPPDLELLFESRDTKRNAHGSPEELKNGLAITVEGKLIPRK